MAPPSRAAPRRPTLRARGLCWFTAALALAGCSHGWDEYDPRLAGGTGGAASSGGGAGGATGPGGSGGTGGAPGTGAGGAGGGDPPGCPGGHLPIVDAFDDGVIGPAWDVISDGVSMVSEEGGALVVTLPDPTLPSMYSGLRSISAHDLTDCAVFTRVSQLTDPTTHAYTHIYVSAGAGVGYIEVIADEGNLLFKKVVAGTHTELGLIAHDPVEHAYWRLRESAGITYWETSADARTWNTQASDPAPIPLSSVHIGLGAGTYQEEPVVPGTARFEGLNVP